MEITYGDRDKLKNLLSDSTYQDFMLMNDYDLTNFFSFIPDEIIELNAVRSYYGLLHRAKLSRLSRR